MNEKFYLIKYTGSNIQASCFPYLFRTEEQAKQYIEESTYYPDEFVVVEGEVMDEYFETINESKKQAIKINESQLRDIIKESLKKVLKENFEDYYNETRDLYFRLDDPSDEGRLIQMIESDLFNNFPGLNLEIEPVNDRNYEYKVVNLPEDVYEEVYNFLSDNYHEELWKIGD